MAQCKECGASLSLFWSTPSGICPACYQNAVQRLEHEAELDHEAAIEKAESASRIILTTETAHNLPVTDRLGIVTAECVIGMNVFRDIASSARDLFGGRSETMQKGLRQAREAALSELRLEAFELGADAVVGVDLDYSEISGGGKSMLFLVASGTAVKLAKESAE